MFKKGIAIIGQIRPIREKNRTVTAYTRRMCNPVPSGITMILHILACILGFAVTVSGFTGADGEITFLIIKYLYEHTLA